MNKKLKIVFISDTHSLHHNLLIPRCDILVHCGDYTQTGTPQEIMSFYEWLKNQTQAKYKVFIEGNHDMHADPNHPPARGGFSHTSSYEDFMSHLPTWKDKFKEHNIYRLFNSEVIIEGLKFWGSPYTPYFHGWGFNSSTDELIENWKQIPDDVDILLTHGPSHGHLDTCKNGNVAGDVPLLMKLLEVRPKIHAFGHIHEQNGQKTIGIDKESEILLINASSLNEFYECTNKPHVIYM